MKVIVLTAGPTSYIAAFSSANHVIQYLFENRGVRYIDYVITNKEGQKKMNTIHSPEDYEQNHRVAISRILRNEDRVRLFCNRSRMYTMHRVLVNVAIDTE